MMIIEQLQKIIDESECFSYGVRCEEKDYYKVGDELRNSHDWWQDDPEDGTEKDEEMEMWDGGELGGTCAISLSKGLEYAIEKAKRYNYGNVIYLIGGSWDYDGNDVDEVVIENAVVLAKIN
ncbi:MAG: hypothetical protein PHR41_09735 [Lactococcus chungangensis]|nr:hypothetical protein [Lactococcus chungangensis]